MSKLSEWLDIMLGEIARKQDEAARAAAEQVAQRGRARSQPPRPQARGKLVQEPVPAGSAAAGTGLPPRPYLPIPATATAVTAFVGRTLKGPVDEPVTSPVLPSSCNRSAASGSLPRFPMRSSSTSRMAVNRRLIVRVASSGRPPTLDLPAGGEPLVLAGLGPARASTCVPRSITTASPPGKSDPFNLVMQRVRSPGSELVEDQEIFRRLSVAA